MIPTNGMRCFGIHRRNPSHQGPISNSKSPWSPSTVGINGSSPTFWSSMRARPRYLASAMTGYMEIFIITRKCRTTRENPPIPIGTSCGLWARWGWISCLRPIMPPAVCRSTGVSMCFAAAVKRDSNAFPTPIRAPYSNSPVRAKNLRGPKPGI